MAPQMKVLKVRNIFQICTLLLISLLLIILCRKHTKTVIVVKDDGPISMWLRDDAAATQAPHLGFRAKLPDVQHKEGGSYIENVIEQISAEVKKPFTGLKLVHIDLKGAPPKIQYLETLLPLIKSLGGNGLLLEYEDMFPYTRQDVSSGLAYKPDQLRLILDQANALDLEVIPLIQTFGHLEFVLKLNKYKDLREVNRYPQAICPSKNESLNVIHDLIDEILDFHHGLNYIHIGCDEVYQLGQCADCANRLRRLHSTTDLFLSHIVHVAKYVKSRNPNVTVLVWDDGLRPISEDSLNHWTLGKWVEPVVWKYTKTVEDDLPGELLAKYSSVFQNLWFATAFKGADAPNSILNNLTIYYENHKSWMNLLKNHPKINFKGVMMTGWQRYDHFSVLCELLPVSMISLAVNLCYLGSTTTNLSQIGYMIQKHMLCDMSPLESGSQCNFPGAILAHHVTQLAHVKKRFEEIKSRSTFAGWMSWYSVNRSYTSPSYVEEVEKDILGIFSDAVGLELDLTEAMNSIYDEETTNEWIATYLRPTLEELSLVVAASNKLKSTNTWPKRPLKEDKIQLNLA